MLLAANVGWLLAAIFIVFVRLSFLGLVSTCPEEEIHLIQFALIKFLGCYDRFLDAAPPNLDANWCVSSK